MSESKRPTFGMSAAQKTPPINFASAVEWIESLTFVHQDSTIRPAAMSYVKPDEYRQQAESLLRAMLEAAEFGQLVKSLMKVEGSSWSVRHPRQDGDSFHFGFSFPMTHEQVVGAIHRGGLGWAPDLETAMRNALAEMEPPKTDG